MRTVRRLYFYLLALIGSQVLLWGAVNLLRTIVSQGLSVGVVSLATGLSLVLVGLPVFALHWIVAQRDAARDEEERTSRIRAVFLYAVRAWTLIPIVYAVVALLNRALMGVMGMPLSASFFGGSQSWSDNLIAVGANLALFLYFESVLRLDWRAPDRSPYLAEARRLYRYLWILFGLILTVGATQGLLRFLLSTPATFGVQYGSLLAASLALAFTGVPIWAYTWILNQESLDEPGERESILRLVVLYIINLAGVVGVLAAGGRTLTGLLEMVLGVGQPGLDFLETYGPTLAILIPMGVLWAYHNPILEGEMASQSGEPRRVGVRRLYRAVLAALGLAVTMAGIFTLSAHIADSLFSSYPFVQASNNLAGGLSSLAIGLPLWLGAWLPLRSETLARGEAGERARRSLVRRAYLYLFVFLFVVGLMVAGGVLIYNVLSQLLGSPVARFGALVTQLLLTLLALAVYMSYHLRVLRQDGQASQQALGALHSAFPVLIIVENEMPLAEEIAQALKRHSPRLPAAVHALERGAPDDDLLSAKCIVLPMGLVLDPPEVLSLWLSAYRGRRLVLPQAREGWTWLGVQNHSQRELAEEAAGAIRQLAEGDAPRAGLPNNPWAVATSILGGLFGVLLLFLLFSLLVTSLYS